MVPLGNGLPVVRSMVRMVNSGAKGLYTRVGSPGTRLAKGISCPSLVIFLRSCLVSGLDTGTGAATTGAGVGATVGFGTVATGLVTLATGAVIWLPAGFTGAFAVGLVAGLGVAVGLGVAAGAGAVGTAAAAMAGAVVLGCGMGAWACVVV